MQARLVGAILPLGALPGMSRWYAASDVFGLKIQDGFAPTFGRRQVLSAGCPGSPGLLFPAMFSQGLSSGLSSRGLDSLHDDSGI